MKKNNIKPVEIKLEAVKLIGKIKGKKIELVMDAKTFVDWKSKMTGFKL